MGVAPDAIIQGGEQDPLIHAGRRPRRGQRANERQDEGAAADLGRAGRTAPDVGGEPGSVGRLELIEQERVDERTGAFAVQGVAEGRVRHISYMT